MDNDWTIEQLQQFINMTGPSPVGRGGYVDGWYQTAADRDDILATLGVVRSILDDTTPGWERAHLVQSDKEFGQMRDAALEAQALLTRADEIAAHFDPPAPALSVDTLHPWVWEPAKPHWRSPHYRVAVREAATGVDLRLQDLVGRRDVSATDLVNQCLSGSGPQPGKPKLRVPDQVNDETTKSVQAGLLALGQACFLLLRNRATHSLADMSEPEALEHLAALSLFARTVQTCTVETASEA